MNQNCTITNQRYTTSTKGRGEEIKFLTSTPLENKMLADHRIGIWNSSNLTNISGEIRFNWKGKDTDLTLLRCPRSSGGSLRSETASITEARRSSEALIFGLKDEDDADLPPADAGARSNGTDEWTVFLAAKRSAMAPTPTTGKFGLITGPSPGFRSNALRG